MTAHAGQTDSTLAARPERPAFAVVYAQHHGAIYGYFRARVLDGNDAEDLAQEVFLRAFGALDRYNPALDVRPWLLGIGRNVLREHVRKVHRRKETAWTELCLELEEITGPDNPYEDALSLLPVCLGGLGESAQQAIQWHYMGGQKLEEIAQRLGRTVGAVKVLMVRSRQALKRCFQAHLGRQTP